jgi:flagellar motor switch/type III secretory pathway protein FliN
MNVREWFPPGALLGDALRTRIERALAEWADAWFGGRAKLKLTALEARPPLWAAELGKASWHRPGGTVALAVPAAAMVRLRSKALDLAVAVREESDRDAVLLRAFERRMLADLASKVEAAIGIRNAASAGQPAMMDDPWSEGPALCAIVAEANGAEAVRIAIPMGAAIAFRKTGLPPARRGPPPQHLGAALGNVRVKVAARLGAAEIGLGDLRGLAEGDVLILDRTLEEPAEILAAGAAQPFARGRLDAGERLTLVLES